MTFFQHQQRQLERLWVQFACYLLLLWWSMLNWKEKVLQSCVVLACKNLLVEQQSTTKKEKSNNAELFWIQMYFICKVQLPKCCWQFFFVDPCSSILLVPSFLQQQNCICWTLIHSDQHIAQHPSVASTTAHLSNCIRLKSRNCTISPVFTVAPCWLGAISVVLRLQHCFQFTFFLCKHAAHHDKARNKQQENPRQQ